MATKHFKISDWQKRICKSTPSLKFKPRKFYSVNWACRKRNVWHLWHIRDASSAKNKSLHFVKVDNQNVLRTYIHSLHLQNKNVLHAFAFKNIE